MSTMETDGTPIYMHAVKLRPAWSNGTQFQRNYVNEEKHFVMSVPPGAMVTKEIVVPRNQEHNARNLIGKQMNLLNVCAVPNLSRDGHTECQEAYQHGA